MNQITAAQFKQAVEMDPAWASKLTEPVEITDYCDMTESKITHLSPLLTFSGRNEQGEAASFWGCKYLKVAEGTFPGSVDFSGSGIEKIGDLNITQPNNNGWAASFNACQYLKVAEGTFPGYVYFSRAGIEKIGELIITQPDQDGDAADFSGCKSLKVAEGAFPGSVSFSESGIEKIGDLNITQPNKYGCAANFYRCEDLRELNGNFPGTIFPPPKARLHHNFKATDFVNPDNGGKAGWEPLLKKWPPNPNSTKSLNEILGILKILPDEMGDIELVHIKQGIKDNITQRLELLKKIMTKQEQSVEIDLD